MSRPQSGLARRQRVVAAGSGPTTEAVATRSRILETMVACNIGYMVTWKHMAYVISMVSQKGGAGKSTLARLLARELAHNGMRVKIADLDTQQTTCTGWASDRAEAHIDPEIQAQPFGNLRTALAEAGRFDAYILDGRPHSSQQTIESARAAHVIIIPTGQTKDDLRPAVQLAHSLVDTGIEPSRIAFALVKTTRSAVEVAAARSYLEQTDYAVLDGDLPISTAYGIAHDAGKTVTETPYRTLNEKAERLAQAIVDRLVALTTVKEAS